MFNQQDHKITEAERRGRFIASLLLFLGPLAVLTAYLVFKIYFVPFHSAEQHLDEIGATVTAQYYSGLTGPSGKYVTVRQNGRKVTLRCETSDWLSSSRIDVYVTPDRHLGIEAGHARWFIIDPATMTVTTSALPYIAPWSYLGSFDFVGARKHGNFHFIRSASMQ